MAHPNTGNDTPTGALSTVGPGFRNPTTPRDLPFNRTNSKEKVGKTCIVATDQLYAFAGYLVRVRLKPAHRVEFVNAYLTNTYGRALRNGMAKAAVNQANINATEMRGTPVALPPESVQDAFATTWHQVDQDRQQQLRAILHQDELFASLQCRAFAGSSNLSGQCLVRAVGVSLT